MNWQKSKVIVFESDDWGGLERGIPDMPTQKRLKQNPHIVRALSAQEHNHRRYFTIMDTLESVADLDDLFKLLMHFRGGDGRPAVFTPVYLLASPDFRAIRANKFTRYVDIGIDKPYPAELRHCGDVIAKAREGIRMGVWVPESHNTRMAAHIDPHKWVRLLREKKDRALNAFFNLKMIGRASDIFVGDMGLEFDSMNMTELRDWIAVGTQYFRNAFGYAPRVTGIADARSRCRVLEEAVEEIMAKNGVKMILNSTKREMGDYERKSGLTHTYRNVFFEPLSAPVEKLPTVWSSTYRQILHAWKNNQPAIISTHRLHYVCMNPAQKAEGLRQLECLLDIIHRKHPDAVYKSSYELARMYRQKKSC